MRVRVDDRIQRAIIEDGVKAAGPALGAFMDLFNPPREEMAEMASSTVRAAFRDVFRRYELQHIVAGGPLDPGAFDRFISAEWSEDEDGCEWVPALNLRGINLRGMTCEMTEERLAAEMMR